MSVIYHYCSIASFFSIIKTKELWLSSLYSTRDKNECKISYRYSNLKYDQKEIDKIISNIFYLSFTKNKDDYLHFNSYGDSFKGISIGVDLSIFKEFITETVLYSILNDILVFENVVYKKKRQQDILKKYREALKNDVFNQPIGYRRSISSNAEDLLAPLFKDINFENEKETRLLFYKTAYENLDRVINDLINFDLSKVRYLEKMSYLERREKIVKNLKSMSNEELYYSLYLEFENFKLTFLKNPNNPSSFVNNNSAIKKIVSINVDRLINRGFIKELCIGPLSEQTVEELKWFLEANSVNISNIKIHKSSIKLN